LGGGVDENQSGTPIPVNRKSGGGREFFARFHEQRFHLLKHRV
jgi:hypothetical protein